MLPISDSEALQFLRAISTADLVMASGFCRFGKLWNVTRISGGDTTVPTVTTLGQLVLYFVNTRDYVIALDEATGMDVPQGQWRWITPGPPTIIVSGHPIEKIDEDDIIVSVATGTRAVIRSADTDTINTCGIAELLDAL